MCAEQLEARQRALCEECRARASELPEAEREVHKAQGRLVKLLLVQGHYDAAMDELSALVMAIDASLGVTDEFAKDALRELLVMHGMYRSAEARETICTTEQWQAALRHRVDVCLQSARGDADATAGATELEHLQSLPQAVLVALNHALQDLVKLRGNDFESLMTMWTMAAQAWENACSASAEPDPERHWNALERARAMRLDTLATLHYLKFDEARQPEYEAALIEQLALISTMLSHPSPHRYLEAMGRGRVNSLSGRQGVLSLLLAQTQMKSGRCDEARRLAQKLVDDGDGSPLVRARAMVLLAASSLAEAATAAQSEDESSRAAALSRAEPLLSRASVLLTGMLEEEVHFSYWGRDISYGAVALEWEELWTCFTMHEFVLVGLGHEEAAGVVQARRLSMFDGWETGEEGEEGEEGDEHGEGGGEEEREGEEGEAATRELQ